MEEVEELCDRIIILDNGKIIAKGTVDELKKLMKEDYSSNLGIKDFECIISLELFKYIQSIMLNMRTIK